MDMPPTVQTKPQQRCVQQAVASNRHLFLLDYFGFQPPRHIAPSLRLFVWNSLLVYHCSFFSKVSVLVICLWLGLSRGDYSPTTTTTPSLRAHVLSDSLLRFQSIQVCRNQPFSFLFHFNGGGAKLSRVAGAPTFPALTPCAASFSASEVVGPSTRSNP
jgi:hypothetical protein